MSWKNIDLNWLLSDIKMLLTSRNPITFLTNLNSIKEKLSSFINNLWSILKFGFSLSDSDSSVSQIYRELWVWELWKDLTKDFIMNSRYFSLKDFFHFALIFNDKILSNKAFLRKYDINPEDNNLENKLILVHNSLQNWSRKDFMSNFDFCIDESTDFAKISASTSYIIDNYNFDDFDQIENFFEKKWLKNLMIKIRAISNFFPWDKKYFLTEINDLISNNNLENRSYIVKKYALFCLINSHFSSIKNVFYLHATNCFRDRNEWSEMSISTQKLPKSMDYLNTFRDVILYLDSTIFSPILTPIVLFNLSQDLSISHKDMLKIQYIMLYFMPRNYREYKIIYKFFNDIEIFYLYDNKSIFDIFKASFSLIILFWAFISFLYFYMPIWIFLPILILAFFKIYKSIFNSSYKLKWNFWIELFSMLILVFSFYSMVSSWNFDFSSINLLVKNAEEIFLVSSTDFADISGEMLKASIFDILK